MSRITVAAIFCLGLLAYEGIAVNTKEQAKKQPQPQQPQSASQKQDEQKAPQATPFNGKCDEKNGRYTVAGQCDAYVECRNGEPEEKLCADGLVFNDKVDLFTFPCQYPIDVDCASRAKLQTPQSTEECPHQFGYFRLGDSTNCGQFMNCADGRGYTFDCPDGLAFNQETYRCDWPDQVADCDAEKFLGFSCPPEPKVAGLGQGEIRFYRSPNSCQKYFVCLEGRPRMYNCGEGNAFNDLINGCDGAENVTNCDSFETNELKARPVQLKSTPTLKPVPTTTKRSSSATARSTTIRSATTRATTVRSTTTRGTTSGTRRGSQKF